MAEIFRTIARLFQLTLLLALYQLPAKLLFRSSPQKSARALRVVFEKLDFAFVKLGQALALRFDLLPADYCQEFLQITNEASRSSIARSGQRVSTLVTYLNDVPAGGETSFPELGWAITPRLGHAAYFEYCDSRGVVDWRSVHAGNPVLEGEKWVASKWMRQRRFVSAA